MFEGNGEGLAPEEIERLTRIRHDRQAILTQPKPPKVRAVMHETALRLPVGGSEVMSERSDRSVFRAKWRSTIWAGVHSCATIEVACARGCRKHTGDKMTAQHAGHPAPPAEAVGESPTTNAVRPWGLRGLRPIPAVMTDESPTYDEILQVAVAADGTPWVTMNADKKWSSIAENDGDEGPSELFGWDDGADVS